VDYVHSATAPAPQGIPLAARAQIAWRTIEFGELVFSVAQTNLQLYRQLRLMAYTEQDIAEIARAYQLAVTAFTGLYRVSGKAFLSHLVGTAGLLASRRAPLALVQAGLLHAIYMNGDLGFQPGMRQSARKREYVRKLVGEEVEVLISEYDALRWTPDTIRRYKQQYAMLSPTQKDTVLIRLANVYEDFMDEGMCQENSRKAQMFRSPDIQSDLLALCANCQWPALSRLLAEAFDRFNAKAYTIPHFRDNEASVLILPPSASRNFLATLLGWCTRRLRRLGILR
jgi:hypothetical protein